MPELYTKPEGAYFYREASTRGPSPPSSRPPSSPCIAFVPALKRVSPFSWFFGAGIGAVVYFVFADRNRRYHDVSGEAIAIPSVH